MRHHLVLFLAVVASLLGLAPAAGAATGVNVPLPRPAPAVTAVSPSPGRLDVFTRIPSDGSLGHMVWTTTNGWSEWESIVGVRLDQESEVAATVVGTNAIEVFARSTDDHVVTTRWSLASGWSSWVTIPGIISAGPTATTKTWEGTVVVAAVSAPTATQIVPPATTATPGEGASFEVTTWNPTTRTAGSWAKLGGGAYPGTSPSVVYRGNGNIDLWVTGLDGQLYATTRTAYGTVWANWRVASTTRLTSTPTMTVNTGDPNHIEITARAADGSIFQAWSSEPATVLATRPATGSGFPAGSTPSSVWFFVRDPNPQDPNVNRAFLSLALNSAGQVMYRSVDWPGNAGAWSGPLKNALPEPTNPPIGATPQAVESVSPSAGRLDLFARSPQTGTLLHKTWTGSWSGWEDLGGSLDGDAPISAAVAPGRMDVFTRNTSDQAITRSWRSSSGWSAWSTLPGTLSAGPSAAVAADGTVLVAASVAWYPATATWNPTTKTAGSWNAIPDSSGSPTALSPSIVARGDGSFDVWITNTGQGLRGINRSASGSWGSWKSSVYLSSAPTAAARPSEPGRIDITGRTRTGTLWHGYSLTPATVTGHEDLGGSISMNASTSSVWWTPPGDQYDRYDIYLIGGGDEIYQKFWSGSSWSSFISGFTAPWPSRPHVANSLMEPSFTRRSDSSSDRYVLNTAYRPYMQARYDRYIAHDSAPNVSYDLISTPLKPWVYVNATGVNMTHLRRVRQAKGWFVPAGYSATERSGSATVARAQTEVIDGQSVPRRAMTDKWYMLDLRIPAARHWWLYGADGKATCNEDRTGDGQINADDRELRSTLDLVACGYKGLWIDNASFRQWHFGFYATAAPDSPRILPPGVDPNEWNAALSNLLAELRAALPPNYPYTINAKWNDDGFADGEVQSIDPTSPYGRELAAADQVIMEGGAVVNTGQIAGGSTGGVSILRTLRYADELHKLGGRIQWELVGDWWYRDGSPTAQDCNEETGDDNWLIGSPIWDRYIDAAEMNLAVALLGFAPGDGIGDMCDYPDRAWRGYDRTIGTALGVMTQHLSGTYVRRFSGGIALFNQRSTSYNTSIPRPGIRIGAPTGTAPSGTVTVPPLSGVVVLYS